MPQIIGVKFKNSPKVYYFSPEGIEFKVDEGTIVETARGVEYGRVVIANKEVQEKEVVQPLKSVIRKATIQDQEQYDRNTMDADKALKTAVEKLEKYKLNMKFSDVEYTFDRKKIIFYFTAPDRVDFRDYVRDLGATFKTRIELRQIHERDDFKMKGALASCGRECCCAAFLNDFEKVSIKMAKNQGLSLNPQKISGLCGKLMCCLRYENENYKEAAAIMPKEGDFVVTPDGRGKVNTNDLLRLRSRVRIVKDDGITNNYYSLDEIRVDNKSNIINDKEDLQEEDMEMLQGDDNSSDTNKNKDRIRNNYNRTNNKGNHNKHNNNR